MRVRCRCLSAIDHDWKRALGDRRLRQLVASHVVLALTAAQSTTGIPRAPWHSLAQPTEPVCQPQQMCIATRVRPIPSNAHHHRPTAGTVSHREMGVQKDARSMTQQTRRHIEQIPPAYSGHFVQRRRLDAAEFPLRATGRAPSGSAARPTPDDRRARCGRRCAKTFARMRPPLDRGSRYAAFVYRRALRRDRRRCFHGPARKSLRQRSFMTSSHGGGCLSTSKTFCASSTCEPLSSASPAPSLKPPTAITSRLEAVFRGVSMLNFGISLQRPLKNDGTSPVTSSLGAENIKFKNEIIKLGYQLAHPRCRL